MKTKRYWLRGGIIGLILGVVMFMVLLTLAFGLDCATDCTPYWYKVVGYISHPLFALIPENEEPAWLDDFSVVIIPINYLIYGVIVGWVYGKIKNRNKVAM